MLRVVNRAGTAAKDGSFPGRRSSGREGGEAGA